VSKDFSSAECGSDGRAVAAAALSFAFFAVPRTRHASSMTPEYPRHLLPLGMRQMRLTLATGISMHVLVQDPAQNWNGVTVVFVHGFPELSVSWTIQMEAMAKLGFRAIAPDMRGYGFSDAPKEQDAYHLQYLTEDLCALLDNLGIEKAVFVGHDWGGFVVWGQVFHNEHRCLGAAVLNTPLSSWSELRPVWTAAECKGPIEYFMKHPTVDAGQLDYQVYFQSDDAVKELEMDVRRTIHAFFRAQLAKFTPEERLASMQSGMRTAKARKDGNRGVLHYAPKDLARDPLWPEAEVEMYVTAFERSGFFGPLSWYRNVDGNLAWQEANQCAPGVSGCKVVEVPCLMVTAEWDVVLNPAASNGMEAYFSNLSRGHVMCGHWVQRESPEETNLLLAKWMATHFVSTSPKL